MKTEIKKYLEGKATPQEILRLTEWLDKKENRAAFKQIKNDWKADPDGQNVSPDTWLQLDRFQTRILTGYNRKIMKLAFVQRFYQYAAVFLLLIAVCSLYLYFSGSQAEEAISWNTVFAENGQISKVLLPDSTVVWLNSGSRLKYSSWFGNESRDVELSGQAYFDVTKNKKLPFVVSCGDLKVNVLGTRFTAEAYPEDPCIQVILVEGAVNLTSRNSDRVFARLKPDEMMVYNKGNNHFEIEEVVAQKYTAWREGIIHIYDQPLKVVAAKLQKRYNQPIVVGKDLDDYKVTFSIRNEDFSEVLRMLLAITPAKAYQEGEVIYLKKK